jgi:phage tail protein X
MKYYTYTTLQGDTFDSIALDFYNDETYSSNIIQANSNHTKVIVFDAGTVLRIPVIEAPAPTTLPPWRR